MVTRTKLPDELRADVQTLWDYTGQNIDFTRDLLADRGVRPASVLLITRPYQQRRAYATGRKRWPEVDVHCASQPLGVDEYVETIGDVDLVINMLVGDTQRITEYAHQGFAIPQEIPSEVTASQPSVQGTAVKL